MVKCVKKIMMVLCLFYAIEVHSTVYQTGNFKVQTMRFEKSQLKVRFSPAPIACEGGENYRMHARVDYSSNGAKELSSILMAAYMSGASFKFLWFSNEGKVCSDTHILHLEMVELSER